MWERRWWECRSASEKPKGRASPVARMSRLRSSAPSLKMRSISLLLKTFTDKIFCSLNGDMGIRLIWWWRRGRRWWTRRTLRTSTWVQWGASCSTNLPRPLPPFPLFIRFLWPFYDIQLSALCRTLLAKLVDSDSHFPVLMGSKSLADHRSFAKSIAFIVWHRSVPYPWFDRYVQRRWNRHWVVHFFRFEISMILSGQCGREDGRQLGRAPPPRSVFPIVFVIDCLNSIIISFLFGIGSKHEIYGADKYDYEVFTDALVKTLEVRFPSSSFIFTSLSPAFFLMLSSLARSFLLPRSLQLRRRRPGPTSSTRSE